MSGTLAPVIKHQFFDNNGDPAAGYQLFTYTAGTSTKADTYTDVDLSVANTNPIILDSAGRATIYLSPTSYKFVLATSTDTDPPTSPVWTQDNVASIPLTAADVDIEGTAGEALAEEDLCYLSEGDGSRTAGRWYKADADLAYGSSTAKVLGFSTAAIASGSDGTFKVAGKMTGLSALTAGTTYYVSATAGAVTSSTSGLTYRRRVGTADSTTTLILSQWIPDLTFTVGTVYTTTGNVGAGEDTIGTKTVTGGTCYQAGMRLVVIAWGMTANNANAKTIKLRAIEGANNNVLISVSATASEAGEWIAGAIIVMTAAATARATCQFVCGPDGGPNTMSVNNNTQPTLTWANDIEIRATGEATDNNDVTLEGLTVEWRNA